MKPRTRIQKEVVRLSSGLPELTDKQKAYAFEHCFKHHAYRTKGGTITCSECGHRWKGGHTLAETICGCSCPHCGKELEILDTRKRVFRDSAYYEIITTRKGYQVLRYFMVGATVRYAGTFRCPARTRHRAVPHSPAGSLRTSFHHCVPPACLLPAAPHGAFPAPVW